MSFAETFYIFQKDQPVSEMDPLLRGTVANMGVTFKGPGIEAGIKTSGSSGIERAEGHIRGVHDVDLLWEHERPATGNDGTFFTGEKEPATGKAFEEIIHAAQGAALKITMPGGIFADFSCFGVLAGNEKFVPGTADIESFCGELFHIDPGFAGNGTVTDNDGEFSRSGLFYHRDRLSCGKFQTAAEFGSHIIGHRSPGILKHFDVGDLLEFT